MYEGGGSVGVPMTQRDALKGWNKPCLQLILAELGERNTFERESHWSALIGPPHSLCLFCPIKLDT